MKTLNTLLTLLALHASSASSGYPVNTTLQMITYKVPSGTAALASYKGKTYLISNWHVCRNFQGKSVEARNEFYGETVTVKVLAVYPDLDTCVMSGTGKPGAEVVKPTKFGMPVYSAGYPGAVKNLQLTKGHTRKVVEVVLDFGSEKKALKVQDTTMKGAPGCSGSAMLNSKAQYVGLVNSVNGETLSALSSDNVVKAIELLKP